MKQGRMEVGDGYSIMQHSASRLPHRNLQISQGLTNLYIQLQFWLMVAGGSVVRDACFLTTHLRICSIHRQTTPAIVWTGYTTIGKEHKYTRLGGYHKK